MDFFAHERLWLCNWLCERKGISVLHRLHRASKADGGITNFDAVTHAENLAILFSTFPPPLNWTIVWYNNDILLYRPSWLDKAVWTTLGSTPPPPVLQGSALISFEWSTGVCVKKWRQKRVRNFFSTTKIGTTHNKVLCYHFIRHPNTLDACYSWLPLLPLNLLYFSRGY